MDKTKSLGTHHWATRTLSSSKKVPKADSITILKMVIIVFIVLGYKEAGTSKWRVGQGRQAQDECDQWRSRSRFKYSWSWELYLILLTSTPPAFRFSHVGLFATPWTIAHQAPLSMRFSRQEYWRRLPFLSPGDPPDPGIKPTSSLADRFFFLLIYFWLWWVCVAVWVFSLFAESRGYSFLQCTGFSLWWLLFLQSMGSRVCGLQ